MKKISLSVLFACWVFTLCAQVSLKTLNEKRVSLPNGWSLTPVGRSVALGDLPLNMTLSSSGKYVAVTNNGESKQTLQLIDTRKEKVLDEVEIPKSWLGIKFSANEKYLYAAGGNDNWILKYNIQNGRLQLADSLILGKKWPNKIWPTGLDMDDSQQRLYVVAKDDSALYMLNTVSKAILNKVKLGAEAYTCVLSPNKTVLYISLWGGAKVVCYDIKKNTIQAEIAVGYHPNDMVLTKNGGFLFVANSDDNSVSVIDTRSRKMVETLNAALYPDAPTGSTTNGVALSADNKTLYIANADNNCLAVFDVSKPGFSKSKGFIPTGWYPTAVKVVDKKIFVTNGKGFSSMSNPYGPNPVEKEQMSNYKKAGTTKKKEVQYIGSLFKGTLSIIDAPDDEQLKIYTRAVYRNTPYKKEKELLTEGQAGNPIPKRVGDLSPIKHVFYVMKENRTYDQVLGDIPEGNGDSSLCLFPKYVTPNQHALAQEFVLLDNFYVDAEVSADGHNWSMAAYATDYTEKIWPTSYGGRGGDYDFGGSRSISFPKKGYIWDHCLRNKISLRNYGEFADDGKPYIHALLEKTCAAYPGWNLKIKDIERERVWEKDFDSLLTINALPSFNIIYFPNDHTSGMDRGAYSPFAAVADNDLAVGRFIDHLSKSAVWKDCAVFILEDDAQNGPDHVDAHRSTAYVISPYVKRRSVDHTMYSTSSMLRTIGLILGMPPMSQYDAAATPMWRCFAPTPNFESYTSHAANVDLEERNVAWNKLMEQSAGFNFAKEDQVPDKAFSELLWKAIKGMDSLMPAPMRSAFIKPTANEEDDE